MSSLEILDNDIGQLMLVKHDKKKWYAYQFASGTLLLFREMDGVIEFKVEQ